jgi:hypothetical protein
MLISFVLNPSTALVKMVPGRASPKSPIKVNGMKFTFVMSGY